VLPLRRLAFYARAGVSNASAAASAEAAGQGRALENREIQIRKRRDAVLLTMATALAGIGVTAGPLAPRRERRLGWGW